LTDEGGRLLSVAEFAFDVPTQGVVRWGEQGVKWRSSTAGDIDGLTLRLDGGGETVLRFTSGPTSFRLVLSDLLKGPVRVDAGRVDQHVRVCRDGERPAPSHTAFTFTEDTNPTGFRAYYVRATQTDGEMAWSFSIYVTIGSPPPP
jgi:hypothetical protein